MIKITQKLNIQKFYFDFVKHEIKVTRIGNQWNIRCYTNGEINQEVIVYKREDIRSGIAEMLRWEDKCGNYSDMARKSRERNYCR